MLNWKFEAGGGMKRYYNFYDQYFIKYIFFFAFQSLSSKFRIFCSWPSSVLQTEFQAVTRISRFVSVRNNSPQPRRANCRSKQEEVGVLKDDERDRHEAGRKASKKSRPLAVGTLEGNVPPSLPFLALSFGLATAQ